MNRITEVLIVEEAINSYALYLFSGQTKIGVYRFENNRVNILKALKIFIQYKFTKATRWVFLLKEKEIKRQIKELPTLDNQEEVNQLIEESLRIDEPTMNKSIFYQVMTENKLGTSVYSIALVDLPKKIKKFRLFTNNVYWAPYANAIDVSELSNDTLVKINYFSEKVTGICVDKKIVYANMSHELNEIQQAINRLALSGRQFNGDQEVYIDSLECLKPINEATKIKISNKIGSKAKKIMIVYVLFGLLILGLRGYSTHLETKVATLSKSEIVVNNQQEIISYKYQAVVNLAYSMLPKKMAITEVIGDEGDVTMMLKSSDRKVISNYCLALEKSPLVSSLHLVSIKMDSEGYSASISIKGKG